MSDSSTATLTCPKCQGAMRSYERNGVTIHGSRYGGKRKRGGFLGELFDLKRTTLPRARRSG